jgi:zinc protease
VRVSNRTMVPGLIWALSACGSAPAPTTTPTPEPATQNTSASAHVEPPAPGPARDVNLPPITRSALANGLELDVVRAGNLPVVYLRLVIKSGMAADPAALPGLAREVATMLKEGTRSKTSAQLADAIEFLGADLSVDADAESITIQVRALSDQLDTVLPILADIAMNPRFDNGELRRLKQREADRLQIEYSDPGALARRESYRVLYGEHPYAHVDVTEASLARIRTTDLSAFHRAHFVPNNAFLVAVGEVDADAFGASAERAFGRWAPHPVPAPSFPALAPRTAREVVVIHRAGSPQSLISIGNLAIARSSPDWVPLTVANQVLGGNATSRLFTDLRERRSLTYGAYSSLDELGQVAPFRARAAVGRDPRAPDVDRTEVAMEAFMEHLERIVSEAAPEAELRDAERFLSDSFPLQIDTAGRIANLVVDLRLFGLPDNYWDSYRSQIRNVTAEQALAAARSHITPDKALVVVVGDASAIAQPLRRWGPVRVVSPDGTEISRFPAAE